MRYLIVNEFDIDQDKLMSSSQTGDDKLHIVEIFSLMHFMCIECSETIFQIISKQWNKKYKEVTEKQAKNGSAFFSEVRPYGKVLQTTNGEPSAYTPAGGTVKVKVTLTDDIKKEIVDFMRIFAFEIIQDEFDTRYKVLRDTTDLEAASWEIQKHEAREWLTYQGKDNHITPFLDYISEERGIEKTILSEKIIEKSEEYQDRLSTMLVDYKKICKKFEQAQTIWDLNILYEDYLGIIMPTSQAIDLGRTITKDNWDRKPEYEVETYVFKF